MSLETRCARCGAAYVATADEVRAGRWWLCPKCRETGVQPVKRGVQQ
jgi:DNA-directed RNA polymerase subunit RPC12/RpoP